METYVGFGFSSGDILLGDLTAFMEKYSPEIIPELCCEVFGNDFRKVTGFDELNADEREDVLNHLENGYHIGSREINEIVSGAVNKAEGVDLLSRCGEYIVFASLRFADDEERASVIRSSEDFIRLILKYFPESDIVFGNVYEGSDMFDPNFHMD